MPRWAAGAITGMTRKPTRKRPRWTTKPTRQRLSESPSQRKNTIPGASRGPPMPRRRPGRSWRARVFGQHLDGFVSDAPLLINVMPGLVTDKPGHDEHGRDAGAK